MSDLQVTPSSLRVNEGDSLTTSLSGFTPGATLFFKVGGRGINKKDFAAGGIKGSVKVDANGVASISHTLRADKKTEGEESFSIQVFSDKKMRNPLGQSDSVSVLDTSVKAPKVGKPPKDGGGVSGGGKDPVTGLYWELYLDDPNKRGRYESDRTYSLDEINRAYSELGVPLETAFTSLSREVELSDRFLIQTNKTTYEDGYSAVGRQIYSGDFKFSKGKLESATIKSVADEIINFKDGIVEGRSGFINNANGSLRLPDASSFNAWLRINNSRQFTQQANYSFSVTEGKFYEGSTFDRNALASFGEGRFFQEGWWNDPFTPNLI